MFRRMLFLVFLGGIVTMASATNLLPNGGFDEASDMTGWDTMGGALATWDVYAEASAPSEPNVVLFSRNNALFEGHAMGQGPIVLQANHVYMYSCSTRDNDGTPDTAHIRTVVEYGDPCTPVYGEARTDFGAVSGWESYQRTRICPSDGRNFYHSVRIDPNEGSIEFDSFELVDVTYGDRMENGGFENSSTRLLNWGTNTAGVTAWSYSSDAAEGDNSLLFSKSTADDALIHKDNDMIPWISGHDEVELSIKLKDVPTIATGELVYVTVAAFGEAGMSEWLNWDSVTILEVTSVWTEYTFSLSGIPEGTKLLSMNFKIKDVAWDDAAGDVLIDDIQLYDTDCSHADFDGDGDVDLYDFSVFSRHWLSGS